jgi:hypothetical protein
MSRAKSPRADIEATNHRNYKKFTLQKRAASQNRLRSRAVTENRLRAASVVGEIVSDFPSF